MNVYALKAYGNYGGGMAVVAAKDKQSAMKIAQSAEKSMWAINYQKPESIDILPLQYDGEETCLAIYAMGE